MVDMLAACRCHKRPRRARGARTTAQVEAEEAEEAHGAQAVAAAFRRYETEAPADDNGDEAEVAHDEASVERIVGGDARRAACFLNGAVEKADGDLPLAFHITPGACGGDEGWQATEAIVGRSG